MVLILMRPEARVLIVAPSDPSSGLTRVSVGASLLIVLLSPVIIGRVLVTAPPRLPMAPLSELIIPWAPCRASVSLVTVYMLVMVSSSRVTRTGST